jgi:hypothetical protein
MLPFFLAQLLANEWGRSLWEYEGHQELCISTASAKFLMPDGVKWDIKLLLITTLLASIASVLFPNGLVSVDLWLLITSNWNTPQIFLYPLSPQSNPVILLQLEPLPLGRSWQILSLPTPVCSSGKLSSEKVEIDTFQNVFALNFLCFPIFS